MRKKLIERITIEERLRIVLITKQRLVDEITPLLNDEDKDQYIQLESAFDSVIKAEATNLMQNHTKKETLM